MSVEGRGAGDALSGDVVLLAVYYDAAQSIVQQYGDHLDGKIVVDITNPVNAETFDGLVTPDDSSAAEELDEMAPAGARFEKAFNTTFANTLLDGKVGDETLDVFIASYDADEKQAVADLVLSAGLNPIDAGSLKRARELEALGFLHMSLQDKLGTGYGSAVKIIS